MTPTHDAYLEDGTNIGLTVGKLIIAYAAKPVNMQNNFARSYGKSYFGNSKINLKMPESFNFCSSSV